MLYGVLIGVGLIVGVIALFMRGMSRYYKKVFSDDHYTEIGNWVHSVMALGSVEQPSFDNRSAYRSSAECAFTFTRDIGEKDIIHIAISQIGRVTTHAASGRLAFLILEILKGNKGEIDFYYTQTSVHHLRFAKEVGGAWVLNAVEPVVANMKSYEPLIPRYEALEQAP